MAKDKIESGDKVKVEYTGSFDDGEVFDTSTHKGEDGKEHSHPLEFEAGKGMVIKGFDNAVIGMKVGEEKTIKIKKEEAYGEIRKELVQKVPVSQMPEGVKKGMILGLTTPDGQQIPARITEIDKEVATVDLNHPLAGRDLNFKIKIVGIE